MAKATNRGRISTPTGEKDAAHVCKKLEQLVEETVTMLRGLGLARDFTQQGPGASVYKSTIDSLTQKTQPARQAANVLACIQGLLEKYPLRTVQAGMNLYIEKHPLPENKIP